MAGRYFSGFRGAKNPSRPATTAPAAGYYTANVDASGFNIASAAIPQEPLMQMQYDAGNNQQMAVPSYETGAAPFTGETMQTQQVKVAAGPASLYCEVCNITCPGAQPYADHLAGKKHKKKLVAAGGQTAVGNGGSSIIEQTSYAPVTTATAGRMYCCNLCGVSCSGPEMLAGHLRGAKHQKAVKKQSALDKHASQTPSQTAANAQSGDATDEAGENSAAAKGTDSVDDGAVVGEDYLEAFTSDDGRIVSYHCKLCECTFTDIAAKDVHLKGRRHRLTYKKKVDSSYQVSVKPSVRATRLQQEKMFRRQGREDHWRRMDAVAARMRQGPPPPGFMGYGRPYFPYGGMRYRSYDDKYLLKKQDDIHPQDAVLKTLESLVASCEQALKTVSDLIAKEDLDAAGDLEIEISEGDQASTEPPTAVTESTAEAATEAGETAAVENQESAMKTLKGVMRVGLMAKGLLLDGERHAELVLLCQNKPTVTLLDRVANRLAAELPNVASDKQYGVEQYVSEACIIVTELLDPSFTCTITLTSPAVREPENENKDADATLDPEDVLDKQKCLEALAALRHAKWFHVRCGGLRWSRLVIRVLRDMSRRVECWSLLTDWAHELLVEKCICYAGFDAGPADVLRTVFGCIASGFLLPEGPGLYDPCEKEATDVTGDLTVQQKEDITTAAQTALRLQTYHQLYTVLGMEKIPLHILRSFGQKRRPRHKADVEPSEEKKLKQDEDSEDKEVQEVDGGGGGDS